MADPISAVTSLQAKVRRAYWVCGEPVVTEVTE